VSPNFVIESEIEVYYQNSALELNSFVENLKNIIHYSDLPNIMVNDHQPAMQPSLLL
jgi:hypothetical protein